MALHIAEQQFVGLLRDRGHSTCGPCEPFKQWNSVSRDEANNICQEFFSTTHHLLKAYFVVIFILLLSMLTC